ncbi:MAG: NAD-dependent epimerase/dehydratase family protein [Alphaproteobacteria bacterium]|nr:NAD-dependent epimerase/dehydratase family protein [Alphaproteobacteria bacterium]
MSVALITGSAGLIGSEAVRFYAAKGFEIVGIDNDMRSYFFGAQGSVAWNKTRLQETISNYTHYDLDIRSVEALQAVFAQYGKDIEVVIHTAAQPSHDWAAREPFTDFTVNANGTLNMLEMTRQHCPDAVFIFTSTNKVYGDRPNSLPLIEKAARWECDASHPYAEHGIDENMSIDSTLHSLFGASKVAADVLVQEYGRYFGMKTGVFRGGCLTGPSHSGAQLHGFLSYLAHCAVHQKPYTVFGYKGKQVRDNIHAHDLITSFWSFCQNPRAGEVYNMGGGRFSNCSMLEAIAICEKLSGKDMQCSYQEDNRKGDHIWWISDTRKFEQHYPEWKREYNVERILAEIVLFQEDLLGSGDEPRTAVAG